MCLCVLVKLEKYRRHGCLSKFDGSLSIVLITSDSVIALNVKLCVQGVFIKPLYVLFPVAEIFDESEGPMFVKKLLNLFAISFFSVIIFPS